MDTDIVDDLQAAEDHIAELEAAVLAVMPGLRHAAFLLTQTGNPGVLSVPIDVLNRALGGGYCRSSCAAGECSPECGCQAHGDGPHPGWTVAGRWGQLLKLYRPDGGYDGDFTDVGFALVERSRHGGVTWITAHSSVEECGLYHHSHDDPADYDIVEVVDLTTGERWQPVSTTTVFAKVP